MLIKLFFIMVKLKLLIILCIIKKQNSIYFLKIMYKNKTKKIIIIFFIKK